VLSPITNEDQTMKTQEFETLSDVELDQVAGGLDLGLSLDWKTWGASVDGAKLEFPSPFKIGADLIGGAFGFTGGLFTATGGALTDVGGLFSAG
jgi:hypothetical protein